MNDLVELIEESGVGIDILECPNCKLRYPKSKNKTWRFCLRCDLALVNASPIKNGLRKIAWYVKLIIGHF